MEQGNMKDAAIVATVILLAFSGIVGMAILVGWLLSSGYLAAGWAIMIIFAWLVLFLGMLS